VTIIPVLEEVLVVEKRLILKEEVHIRQTTSGEAVEVPVTLRRQHAVVERVSADGHVSEIPPKEQTP
jgi:stress response protein YsnF